MTKCQNTKGNAKKLLKERREQMRDNLNKNSRVRAIILDSSYVNNFDANVVQFIEDFVNKYNSKIKLHYCPLFSLVSDESVLNDVWKRLNTKNIIVERGYIEGELDVDHFLREPLKEVREGKLEFKVRLCLHDNDFEKVMTKAKLNDLFIISDKEFDFLKTLKDTNVEKIETREFNEIKYLLSLNSKL